MKQRYIRKIDIKLLEVCKGTYELVIQICLFSYLRKYEQQEQIFLHVVDDLISESVYPISPSVTVETMFFDF